MSSNFPSASTTLWSTLTLNQLLNNVDIILSNFTFSEPIENLQTCISMVIVSSAYVRKIIEHAHGVSKLHAFAGFVWMSVNSDSFN